jgi:type VI secretion system protein ImpB
VSPESVHQKLDRVRKPRVHITYKVQVGGALEDRQLPFVVGVLADLSGQPSEPLPRLKERSFVHIDRDNFDEVLAGMKPRLTMNVPNRLTPEGGPMGVELEFRKLEDFSPEGVAQQIEPLRQLVAARQKLHELSLKVNASERLDDLLQQVLENTDTLRALTEPSTGKPEEKK